LIPGHLRAIKVGNTKFHFLMSCLKSTMSGQMDCWNKNKIEIATITNRQDPFFWTSFCLRLRRKAEKLMDGPVKEYNTMMISHPMNDNKNTHLGPSD